jgi:Tol biopolymer transport system component
MPYLDGESLRDRLNREKQLPIEDALQITKEVADALGYAHEQGIIHRDIKPENILFQRGHALVADFGIARALTAAGAETLTATGLAVGTPAYMSPEQGVGSSDLDGRSDLYSLGCVLYEMLSGETPYLGSTPQAIIAKKLSGPTPRVSVVRDKVPPAVEAALDRVLSRNAVDRFATAEQFAAALRSSSVLHAPTALRRRAAPRSILLGAVAVVVLGVAGWLGFRFIATESRETPLSFGQPRQVTFSGDMSAQLALSPDGSSLVYVEARTRLVVLNLATQIANIVWEAGSLLRHPVWHPSGDSVIVLATGPGATYAVPSIPGGTPRRMVDARSRVPAEASSVNWLGLDISPDGERIAVPQKVTTSDSTFSRIVVLSSSAGPGMPADTIPLPWDRSDFSYSSDVAWSPAGDRLAVSAADKGPVVVLLTTAGVPTDTLEYGRSDSLAEGYVADLHWSADGRALYWLVNYSAAVTGRQRFEILRVPVDRDGRFAGDPVSLFGVADGEVDAFAVSGDGRRIFYVPLTRDASPWVVDVGDDASISGRRPLLTGTTQYGSFSFSADGSRFAFGQAQPRGIYVGAVSGESPETLVVRDGVDPSISPDGGHIAFLNEGVVTVDISTGEQRRVHGLGPRDTDPGVDLAWSPDGRRLAWIGDSGITVVDLETGHVALPVAEPTRYRSPHFSPDGRRLAVGAKFVRGGGIWILDLADSTFTPFIAGAPSLSSDGEQWWRGRDESVIVLHWSATDTIYFTGKVRGDVWAVSAAGGDPQLYVAIPDDCAAEVVAPVTRKVICIRRGYSRDIWSVEAQPVSR